MVHNNSFSDQWPKIKFVEFFDNLEETINKIGPNKIAGVLIDTVPWVDGLTSNNQNYWDNFQTLITKHNLILCVDEVLTGIGRMGVWLHSHSLNLKPNIVILGKALTAGHENLSCSLFDENITEEIKNTWLPIGNTRSVNTMGAVVACSVINKIKKENTLDHINGKVIPYVKNLEKLFLSKGYNSRSEGTMIQCSDIDIKNFEIKLRNQGLYHYWDKFWHLSFYNITLNEMNNVTEIMEKLI